MSNHIEDKLKRGTWIAVYPYGYQVRYNEAGIKTIVIDKKKAWVVRKLFTLYSTNEYSLSMLESYCQKELKVPLYKARIENILKNKFYYGVMEVKGAEYLHNYPHLITKKEFDVVNKIMKNRRGNWKIKKNKKDE